MSFLINYYKKYIIKVPKNISVFYFKNKKLIIFKNKKKLKFLSIINYKLSFLFFKNKVYIFTTFYKMAYYKIKKLNCFKKTILSFLKQFIIELEVTLYNKIKLVGIGYKILQTDLNNKILLFKLGYSHSIYFKVNFKFFILKSFKLFIIGYNYQSIMQILSTIRSFKIPEPYKGKGILYDTEHVKIKNGKKS